jgi:transposase InsO family protein
VSDVYAAIEQVIQAEGYAVTAVCDTLGVSRAGYYAWRRDEETARSRRDGKLSPMVRDIFWEHRRRYGARRIAIELQSRGESCGVAHVAKLLKMQGLRAIQPRSFRPRTTESRHGLGYSPNLLLEGDEPLGLNELWVGDISYVPLREQGFGYLALLLDRHSRRIVGWHYSLEMSEALTLAALAEAIRERQPPAGLIHHTDRGGQYAGKRYRGVLRRAGMRQSMSRAGNCYDNAFVESCFGTIKTELEMVEYEDSGAAQAELTSYIAYYNVQRRHSALRYLTPVEFENRHTRRK